RATPARPEPPLPGLSVRLELGLRLEDVIDGARLGVPELMTEVAVRLQRVDPLVLRLHRRSEPVALRSRTGKLARGRRFEERQPVVAGIDARRFERSPGDDRGQRDRIG